MGKAELMKRLFAELAKGNFEDALSAAWALVDHERQLGHRQVATDLAAILEQSTKGPNLVIREQLPLDPIQKVFLVDRSWPNRFIDEVMLSPNNRHKVGRALAEYRDRDKLVKMRLRYKSKLLFCGPPGSGKTLCAETIAGELGLPLLYANFDAIISSYLGETASNLRKVFEAYQRTPSVLFFDEVDAIGKSREDRHDVGELKRVVNSFLQLLDKTLGQGIVIAATNHAHLLDSAVWRRFDDILFFTLPQESDITAYMQRKLRIFKTREADVESVAGQLLGLSYADIERICYDAAKTALLDGRNVVRLEDLREEVSEALNRVHDQMKTTLSHRCSPGGEMNEP